MKHVALLLASALALGGCARLTAGTDLHPDGSWSRHVRVARSLAANQASPEDKITDLVKFSGPGWKTETKTEKSDEVYMGTRSFASGEPGGEDFTLGYKDKVAVSCAVKWTPQGDGKMLYEETYTWKGELPDQAKEKENRAKFKASVAKGLAALNLTDAQTDKLVDRLMDRLWAELMGPNKPRLFDLVLRPEETLRELRTAFFQQTLDELRADKLGSSESQRKDAARALAKDVIENSPFADKTEVEPPAGPPDEKEKKAGPMQVTSSLGFNGDVIETNGDVDIVDGRIYWSMISEACQRGKVTFRALIDTKK
ncbi:MAG: hypothetical protein KF857_08685 [Fimbriimonadaceae bacterium]|nr:hypothetical protein [Fimbriimonadaceae bacterium]